MSVKLNFQTHVSQTKVPFKVISQLKFHTQVSQTKIQTRVSQINYLHTIRLVQQLFIYT